jgi:hypothetical protein
MRLSKRETATLLAALRHFQTERDREISGEVMSIATDHFSFDRLDDDEIDALCERINTEG